MTPLRVVLDTNTVVMPIARRTRSNDSWIIREWQIGKITPLVSEATRDELLKTLRDPKFELEEENILSVAAIYLDYCDAVEIPDPPPNTPKCDDESDQKFLILAYQAGADALVSGDGRLTALRDLSEIPILTKREFILKITNM